MPQKSVVGKDGVTVGSIQEPVHIVDVILNFLGEKMGVPDKISGETADQQAGNQDELDTAV